MATLLNRVDCQLKELRPWFYLRAAIFRQAFMDWEESSQASRDFVLSKYAKWSKADRDEAYSIACEFHLKWRKAADVWNFFHSTDSDTLLIDTKYRGKDVWRMYMSGSWNRNGIKDKPYRIAKLPTTEEAALPLPDKYKHGGDPWFVEEQIKHERRETKGEKQ